MEFETELFGRVDVTTDIVNSQDLQQLEPKDHMSWLPTEKLTTEETTEEKEEKEIIQEYNQRKTTLLGNYTIQIKDLETTHETWIGNFRKQHKKRLQKYQELYATEQQKIDQAVYSTYKQVLDTYNETKDKASSLVDQHHQQNLII